VLVSGRIEQKVRSIVGNGDLEMAAKLLVFFQAIYGSINGEKRQ
jgi:hypothetical protein